MNTIWVSILSMAAGVVLGLAATAVQLGPEGGERIDVLLWGSPSGPSGGPPLPDGRQPEVQVDAKQFDFGVMAREARGSHAFKFENLGDAPLILSEGPTSCRCTLSEVPAEPIPPGESVYVSITWKARADERQFRETATVRTNDPDRPTVELAITGRITETLEVRPRELVFSRVAAGEAQSQEIQLLSYDARDLDVLGIDLKNAETAAYFDVSVSELPPDQLPDPEAESGLTLTVTVQPGLPIGRFQQQLDIITNVGASSVLEIPIHGLISGDVSLVGQGWIADRSLLVLGSVSKATGQRRRLTMFIRGDEADDFRITSVETRPDWLEIEIGEKRSINRGKVATLPLEIIVPAGSPSVSFLNTAGSDPAEVVLHTSHSRAKRISLRVQFVVEG